MKLKDVKDVHLQRILNGQAGRSASHVKKLRSKMGEKGDYIKTIWGMGYKFEVSEE